MTPREIVSLVAARAAPDAMVAFDADGTLWSGDIGMDTFQEVLARKLLRREASEALMNEAQAYGLPRHGDPNEQAAVLYRAFEQGRYAEERAFAMMAWALAGHTTAEVERLAHEVVTRARLVERVLPESMWIAQRLVASMVPVFIVSASPTVVVRAALAHVGLPVTGVFGMTAATQGEVLTPQLAGTPTYGPGKAQTLREACAGMRLEAAFGDSTFDLAMLSLARVPVAVRPKPDLVARRGECPGLVELSRLGPQGVNPP